MVWVFARITVGANPRNGEDLARKADSIMAWTTVKIRASTRVMGVNIIFDLDSQQLGKGIKTQLLLTTIQDMMLL